jgi:hypothetical protein
MNLRIYFWLVLTFCSFHASACLQPDPEQVVDSRALVKRTKNIYLAKVISMKPDSVFHFRVLKTLKGSKRAEFEITGSEENEAKDSFQNHSNADFWKNSSEGRASKEPDCEITPNFKIDSVYLVFFDPPYHMKSFEEIANAKKDNWLKHIKELLTKP